jgi:hypothetical protein
MSPVNYKFKDETSFAFYILNAVAHDFIHDFNNYIRMNKILSYIMELARDVGLAVAPSSVPMDTDDISLPTTGKRTREDDENGNEADKKPRGETTPMDVSDEGSQDIGNDNIETDNISTNNLLISQKEENFKDEMIEPITTTLYDTELENIKSTVNTNIDMYNQISSNVPSVNTRATIKKLNVLQKLKDFIQESKYLIISKLRSLVPLSYLRGGSVQKGGYGLDIITREHINLSIDDIISEINETITKLDEINTETGEEIKQEDLKHLIHYYEYIKYSYNYLDISKQGVSQLDIPIPEVSQLEILNNSIIEDSASIFIVGQCYDKNISEYAKLCLQAILGQYESSPISDHLTPVIPQTQTFGVTPPAPPAETGKEWTSPQSTASTYSLESIFFGGAFSKKIYRDNQSRWYEFERKIAELQRTDLYQIYCSKIDSSSVSNFQYFYDNYAMFISGIQDIIIKITGPQTFNIKTRIIQNLYNNLTEQPINIRNVERYKQELLDTIIDFVFTKTIKVYEDIKNKMILTMPPGGSATSSGSSPSSTSPSSTSSTSSLPPHARVPVQRVSQLVAKKVLELTGLRGQQSSPDSDLQKQIDILEQVASGTGFTSVDDELIKYFNRKKDNASRSVKVGSVANTSLDGIVGNCVGKNCRIINNAVPTQIKAIIERTGSVVCPTSSVCDGMQSFGSCVSPRGKQEYYDMDFSISYPVRGETPNMYYGKTTIKSDQSSVNVNYGIIYNDLKIFNFIDIKIDSPPVVLQANFVYKTLINRIIEIWKTATNVSTIDELWQILEGNDYFLSILKLGSQKAVGDIFQEINSTLYNGGYARTVEKIGRVNTYGLMGDRPSGIRVVKLLLDFSPSARDIVNTTACGGYVGGTTSLIYFPRNFSITGGKKITRKRKHKYASKTKNNNRKVKQQTKRIKRRRHKTRRY